MKLQALTQCPGYFAALFLQVHMRNEGFLFFTNLPGLLCVVPLLIPCARINQQGTVLKHRSRRFLISRISA